MIISETEMFWNNSWQTKVYCLFDVGNNFLDSYFHTTFILINQKVSKFSMISAYYKLILPFLLLLNRNPSFDLKQESANSCENNDAYQQKWWKLIVKLKVIKLVERQKHVSPEPMFSKFPQNSTHFLFLFASQIRWLVMQFVKIPKIRNFRKKAGQKWLRDGNPWKLVFKMNK